MNWLRNNLHELADDEEQELQLGKLSRETRVDTMQRCTS